MNKAGGDDGIPVELFQILKDDAVKLSLAPSSVLVDPGPHVVIIHSVCECVSRSVVSDSSDPMDCSLPGSSVHGTF